MKKIAIFVEGQTEQIFIASLIKQIVGEKHLVIDTCKLTGKDGARKRANVRVSTRDKSASYYFIIFDSSGDAHVKSDIRDNIESLQRSSFSFIFGVRDLYPKTDIVRLRKFISYGLKKSLIPIHFLIAVQEIEAWFIAEENHYKGISQKLTIENVNSIAGIDVANDSTETISIPSKTLQAIYNSVGVGYQKTKRQVQRTVKVIDYENLYFNVRERNNSFKNLLDCLDTVFEAQNA